ncbi:MAG: hypothetical protein Q8P41_14480 [Pseudomonadota bacterium]|nr:hypothetical protein [Pseudomonadota bacterium]
MSDRNTGLFLPGHVPAAAIAAVAWGAPGVSVEQLRGDEAVRVGHGTRDGRPYTHVGLRLFEVGGLLLLDQPDLPGADELERVLGDTLSARYGQAVFLFYDEVNAAGGHARFEGGRLVSRLVYDGRGSVPVRRTLGRDEVLVGLDPSDWVWVPGAAAVEAGAAAILGPGIRDDDDIERLITGAAAVAVEPPTEAPPSGRGTSAPPPARPSRLRGLLRRLVGRGS